jgi:adenylate cyclase
MFILPTKARDTEAWIVMIIALFFGYFFSKMGYLDNSDHANTDRYQILSGIRNKPKLSVIVSIDEEALNFFPNTPLAFWGPYFAKAIEQLKMAGAVSIALDASLNITPEQWFRTFNDLEDIPSEVLNYDQTFDQTLAAGHVILAASPIHDKKNIVVPLPAKEYIDALPNHLQGIGLTTLIRDSDTIIRRMVPAFEGSLLTKQGEGLHIPEGYTTPNPWWTFAALAVREGFSAEAIINHKDKSIFSPRPIAFCGPPGTIPRISLAALFRDKGLSPEEKALIKGRIAFIGSDYEGFGDHQPTPYSNGWYNVLKGFRDMSSVEIHANIAETLLRPDRITEIPLGLAAMAWFLSLLCVVKLTNRFREFSFAEAGIDFVSALILWLFGLVLFLKGYLFPFAGFFASLAIFFLSKQILQTMRHDKFQGFLKYLFGKYK